MKTELSRIILDAYKMKMQNASKLEKTHNDLDFICYVWTNTKGYEGQERGKRGWQECKRSSFKKDLQFGTT